jgi:hypothetical protein
MTTASEDHGLDLDGRRRAHPPARLGRARYLAACAEAGETPREDEDIQYGTARGRPAEPHLLRLRMLQAEGDESRWTERTGFSDVPEAAGVLPFPGSAPLREPYTGLGEGAAWEGGQAFALRGTQHVPVDLPGHPLGWFVESKGPIPLVVGREGSGAPAFLGGTRADGLRRDISVVSHVKALVDAERGGFRILTRLVMDDYLDSPLGHGDADEDPSIEVISRAGSEEAHRGVPGESLESLVARATEAGRAAVDAALVRQATLVANLSRFAAFVESLPGEIDGPGYAASVRALGLEPHLDHEIADEEQVSRWPSVGRSCGHADIYGDEAAMRSAAARLLDEVRLRTVRAVLSPAPSGPTP